MEQLKLPFPKPEKGKYRRYEVAVSQQKLLPFTCYGLSITLDFVKSAYLGMHTITGVRVYGHGWEAFKPLAYLHTDDDTEIDVNSSECKLLESEQCIWSKMVVEYIRAEEILGCPWDIEEDISITLFEYDSILNAINSMRPMVPKEELFDKVCGMLGFRYQGHVMQMIFENYYKIVGDDLDAKKEEKR